MNFQGYIEYCWVSNSALAELRRAAGGFEAVLFALLHAGIAGEVTGSLELSAVVLIQLEQGAGNAVTDGAGLAGDAAAADGGFNVDLAEKVQSGEGLADQQLQGLQTEVIVDIPAVDGDGAGAVGEEVNAGHGGFPTAGPVEISLLAGIHLLSSLRPDLGFLRRMLVLAAGVDLQTLQLRGAQLVLAQHALHGQFEGELGPLGHQVAVLGLMETAGIAGVGAVVLLIQLLAGEKGLVGIDDDDELTAVHMGGVSGLQFAAEQIGGDDGSPAKGLVCGVKHIPFTLHIGLVCHESGHSADLQTVSAGNAGYGNTPAALTFPGNTLEYFRKKPTFYTTGV